MNFTQAQKLKASILLACAFSLGSFFQPAAAEGDFNETLSRGDAAIDQGQLEEAAQAYEEAIKLDPESPVAHNQLGLCYSRRNMLLEAAGEFNKALSLDPNFLASLNNLGSIMYRQSKYDEAISFYKKALAVKEADPEVQVNLASVYRDKATYVGGKTKDADFTAAINLYLRALADSPTFAPAHNNLGLCYLRLRRFNEAEQEVQRAVELKNDYAAAYFNLGLIYQAQQKLPDAVAAFQNSLRHETVAQYADGTRRKIQELGLPESTSNTDHFSRGFDLLSQKKWAEAEAEFKLATTSQKDHNAVAWNNLGYARSRQGKNKQAIEAYVKAIGFLDQFPAAHYNYGQALVAVGEMNTAEREFRKAVDQARGRYPLARNALAIVLKQKGDSKGALSQYKLALMQSGDTLPVIHYNLGLLYEQEGNKTLASDEYQHYLTQSPSGFNASLAHERLKAIGVRQ